MSITFDAKNLAGDVHKISYKHFDEISTLLTNAFENNDPLYEPVWLNEDGNEKFIPKNNEEVYVLFRYINVPVSIILDWSCVEGEEVEEGNYKYTEYTILIESKDMKYVYEEVVLTFFYDKSNKLFYSEEGVNIIEEDRGSLTKYIHLQYDAAYFTSIKDLFLSFKNDFQKIPEDFFIHLSECVENKWNICKFRV